jgi:hypothetical protein
MQSVGKEKDVQFDTIFIAESEEVSAGSSEEEKSNARIFKKE